MTYFTCTTCRRELERQTTGGTGYGVDKDGAKHCYQCCALAEFDSMVETGKGMLYLGVDTVHDWAGHLAFKTLGRRYSRHGGGFGSQRTDFWFTGPDGALWHGINRGDMDLARVRRTKSRGYVSPENQRRYQERKRVNLAAHIVESD